MRILLATAVAIAPLLAAAGAQAEIVISSDRTTPIRTSNATGTAADNIRIASGGSITLTSGTAVTLDSNNTVTVDAGGSISMLKSDDGATAILAQGGRTGGVKGDGAINITDTLETSELHKPFATGTDRYGVRVTGPGAFIGNVEVGASGSIKVEGNNSYAMSIESALNGNLSMLGALSVVGDNTYGLRTTGAIDGNVTLAGSIAATGLNARGASLEGDISGGVKVRSSIATTGYRYTTPPPARPTGWTSEDKNTYLEDLDANDLLQGGPALTIAANIAKGVLLAVDYDDKGEPVAGQTAPSIVSLGGAPAIQIGSDTQAITLGVAGTGNDAYGFVNRGTVTGSGVYAGVNARALQLGTASGQSVTVDGGVMTKASFRNALTVYDLLNRQATVDTDSYDLKFTWKDERWFASAHAGISEASGGTGKQVFGEFLNKADYSYDISGKTPSLNFHGYQTDPVADVATHMKPGHAGSPFTDPSAYRFDGGGPAGGWHTNPPSATNWGAGWGGNIVTKPTKDEERYFQVDGGVTLDSPIYQVRFGLKRREHETSQSMAGVSLASIKGYGDLTADQFSPKDVPNSYLSGFGNVGDLSNRFMIDGWALADYINSGKWLAPWQTMPTPSTFSDPSYAANTWTVKEDINAAYIQADFSHDRLRGNFGVRLVQTESESTGYTCSSLKSPCPADGYVLSTVKKKYNNVLPNLNVAYDLNDSVVLRGSAAKVISRPNYGDMSSYLWIGDQTLTGGGGNPNLDPYESTNLDLSAEWYFAENAILAGTAFYKKVDNYILVTTQKETHYNQSQQTDTEYDISRPNNAGGAKIQGFSAAFQTSLDNGLGLLANYTYADAKADAGNRLPFNSKNQVNFSPFYESERWSARVTYSWRSKYYTQADRGNFLVTDDYDSLDANINVKLTDNLTLGLDGMNLLDSEYRSYAEVPGVANTEKVIRGLYRTGRRYMATLRFAF